MPLLLHSVGHSESQVQLRLQGRAVTPTPHGRSSMLVQGGEGWLANYLSTLSPALRTLRFPPPHACTHPNEDIPSFCKKTHLLRSVISRPVEVPRNGKMRNDPYAQEIPSSGALETKQLMETDLPSSHHLPGTGPGTGLNR